MPHAGSLVVECEIYSCGMWDEVTRRGIKPRTPALGAHNHWTNREVPRINILELTLNLVTHTVPNAPAMRETWVRSLGWAQSLVEGM